VDRSLVFLGNSAQRDNHGLRLDSAIFTVLRVRHSAQRRKNCLQVDEI